MSEQEKLKAAARPSDDLLFAAWREGASRERKETDEAWEFFMRLEFEKWVKGLPIDPLAKDRD